MCMGTCGWCVCISKKLLIFSIKLSRNKNLPERSKCNLSLYISFLIILSWLINEILLAFQTSNTHDLIEVNRS